MKCIKVQQILAMPSFRTPFPKIHNFIVEYGELYNHQLLNIEQVYIYRNFGNLLNEMGINGIVSIYLKLKTLEFFPIGDFRQICHLPNSKIVIFVDICRDVKLNKKYNL